MASRSGHTTGGEVRLQSFSAASMALLVVVPLLLIAGLGFGTWLADATTTDDIVQRHSPGSDVEPTTTATVPTTIEPTAAPSSPEVTEGSTADVDVTETVPDVDAAAYVVVEAATGEVLAERSPDERRPIGSITKLMTARVVLQAGDLDDVVSVPPLDPDSEESRIGLDPDRRYRRDVLLRAMLIVSASDAARALAVDVAGSQAAFAEMMNAEAAALGLEGTHFVGPVGLDHPDHYSTARDVAVLGSLLMQDETFQAIVSRRDATLHGVTTPATNELLGAYPGADGIKTGHTDGAGWCIAASATRDGRRVVVVILGSSTSDARNAAAMTLLDWAFST